MGWNPILFLWAGVVLLIIWLLLGGLFKKVGRSTTKKLNDTFTESPTREDTENVSEREKRH